MKITIVQGAFLPVPPLMGGGVEKVWWALSAEFARRGHSITHISRRHPGLPPREAAGGIEHVRVRGFDAPRSLLRLKWLDLLYSLRALRVLPAAEVLVTNTFWMPLLVRSTCHGKLYVHVARYPKGQMKFYRHAARLQTVSRAVADAIRAEAPALAARVRTIPNPCNSAFGPAASSDKTRDKTVLYVGRIHPEKGIQLLIDALLRLKPAEFGGWKLMVVGPADEKFGGGGASFLRQLREMAAPLGDRVVWLGAEFDQEKLALHYQRARVFAYPSLAERGETFGLAPLEAMACGCAPVVSDLACFRDFITDGKTGYVFDHRAGDPAGALAGKLRSVLGDLTGTMETARRAERCAQAFRIEPVATRYLEDFASLTE